MSSAKPVVELTRQEGGGWLNKGAMKDRPAKVKPEAMRIRPMTWPGDVEVELVGEDASSIICVVGDSCAGCCCCCWCCYLVKPLMHEFATMRPYECAMITTSRPCVISAEITARAASTSSLNVAFGSPMVDGRVIDLQEI